MKIKPGTPFRNILATSVEEERICGVLVKREHMLHATKGYRAIRT